jgi:hypothetical protein
MQCRCGPTGYFAKMEKNKNNDSRYILTAMIFRLAKKD